MKKKIIIIISLIYFLVLPIAVLAQTPTIPDVDVIEVLGRLTNWLWTILLMAGVIAVIISGYMFVTSGGDPERIRTAWKLAVYSIVGVIVAGLAWGIVAIIRAVVEG